MFQSPNDFCDHLLDLLKQVQVFLLQGTLEVDTPGGVSINRDIACPMGLDIQRHLDAFFQHHILDLQLKRMSEGRMALKDGVPMADANNFFTRESEANRSSSQGCITFLKLCSPGMKSAV